MKKKVLFIIWTLTGGGGSERILANIVNNLDIEKYEISILEYMHMGLRNESIREEVKILKPVLKDLSIHNNGSSMRVMINKVHICTVKFMAYVFPALLRKCLIKDHYDVEIAFNHLFPSFLISKNDRVKKFLWYHGSVENLDYTQESNFVKRIKTWKDFYFQNKANKKFNRIIAISNRTYDSVVDIFEDTNEKLIKIYNGFNFKDILYKSMEPLGWPYKDPVIIGVGRLDANKNFSLLIDAAKIIKDSGKNFKVIILGEGEEMTSLQSQINNLGLEDYVILNGYSSNPFPYIKNAKVLCVTSKLEGFPTVIAEGMALGCPFISTKVAGADELSNEGNCGFLVDYNVKELSEKLITLIDNKDNFRDRLSTNCVEHIQKYSLSDQIKNIENILDM